MTLALQRILFRSCARDKQLAIAQSTKKMGFVTAEPSQAAHKVREYA